jgi:hypothetical protein
MEPMSVKAMTDKRTIKAWFKRMGVAGFLFFLIKGLLWLLIPYLITKGLL